MNRSLSSESSRHSGGADGLSLPHSVASLPHARISSATDIGRVRTGNEDSFSIFEPAVFVIADGMGGHLAGEVASRTLVETVRQELGSRTSVSPDDLAEAVKAANQRILAMADGDESYRGMGTTATLFHIEADTLCWAHVGDSRLYRLHEGGLSQVTRDHSYVEELVDRGEITQAEARVHPKKNILIRAVGADPALAVDTGSFPVESGDVLLLATDGLTNMVTDEEIWQVLSGEAEDKADLLVRMAVQAGGTDNVTVIVLEYAS